MNNTIKWLIPTISEYQRPGPTADNTEQHHDEIEAETVWGVAEVTMAAPAVAKTIITGVIASVYCRNKEAPCSKKYMLVLVIFGGLLVIKVWFTFKKLQVLTSLVWRNKDTSRVKLSSLFVDF